MIVLGDTVVAGDSWFTDTLVFPPVDVAAGDLIVVTCAHQIDEAFSSITDDAGNTYQFGAYNVSSGGGNILRFAWAYNCAAQAANVVTLTYPNATAYTLGDVTVISGCDAAADPYINAREGLYAGAGVIDSVLPLGEAGDFIAIYMLEDDNSANGAPPRGNTLQLGSPDGTYFTYGYGLLSAAAVISATTNGGASTAASINATFRAASTPTTGIAKIIDVDRADAAELGRVASAAVAEFGGVA